MVHRLVRSRAALFIGFAFAVMADPVSSVAYAIEAATRALGGDLTLLLPTILIVIGIIAVVVVNYQSIVERFPHGGGAAAASAAAFGFGWAFLPLGALIVDFVLTIAISVAAAASAVIAYLPVLAPARVEIALALVVGVAGLTLLGHVGRLLFATMTLTFIGVVAVILWFALTVPVAAPRLAAGGAGPGEPLDPARIAAILLAFPVAMALATGVEAPSSAIAQLGQLDDDGRRRFGRRTLWLTLGIVGTVTLGLSVAAVHLGVGIPPANSTEIAEIARTSSPPLIFGLFQLTSAVLLLAAASSSFQAGPGLLKALARSDAHAGVLGPSFRRTNRHHTPVRGVAVFLGAAGLAILAAGGRDQELVLFYAVAVFVSFLAGLAAIARLHATEGRRRRLIIDLAGLGLVAFTLAVNLARGLPIVSLGASLLIAAGLYLLWVRAGRPTGLHVEEEVDGNGASVHELLGPDLVAETIRPGR